ncbi:hypothetical protein ACSBR1_029492 [Camellia fascicularis]
MGNKKKFINKKQSATFQLLARDSSDPNYTDGTSGNRIFVRVDNNSYSPDTFFEGDEDGQFADNDPNSVFADARTIVMMKMTAEICQSRFERRRRARGGVAGSCKEGDFGGRVSG